jgi:Domain of unknown function (DUF4367)
MKKEKLNSVLSNLAEKSIPSAEIDLWPVIQNSINKSNWHKTKGDTIMNKTIARHNVLRLTTVVVFILLVVLGIVFATPQGRAFAQKVFLFFNTTNDKSFALPTDQLPAFAPPNTPAPEPVKLIALEPYQVSKQGEPTQPVYTSCISAASQTEYYCQIKAVESKAGFDVKEFPYDPKGTEFSQVTYNADINQVTTEYVVQTGGGYLYLRQGVNEFLPGEDQWSKVPSDSVEQVTVNGNYGEIAIGTYIVYPGATSAEWVPGGQLSLVWREGKSWFVLEKLGDPYPIEWITKDELIKLAESLVNKRPLDAAQPMDPENLKSIAEAEKLAGFDAVVPTLLPQGYELKRIVSVYDSIRLFFGNKNSREYSLSINIGPIEKNKVGSCTECPPGTVEVVNVGQWQGWYWQGIYFVGPSTAGQPTSTPEWQGDSPNWQLAWNTDSLYITMSYYASDNTRMNKETMIAIAESIK